MDDPNEKSTPYPPGTVRILQFIYIAAIFLWIFLILIFKISLKDTIGLLLLAVPIIIFLLSFVNVARITVETESKLFNVTYLSIGVFVIIPMVTNEKFSTSQIMKISTMAMILAVFSLLDVWVPPDWVTIIRHVRSILQISSLSLIVYALYLLFTGFCEKGDAVFKTSSV